VRLGKLIESRHRDYLLGLPLWLSGCILLGVVTVIVVIATTCRLWYVSRHVKAPYVIDVDYTHNGGWAKYQAITFTNNGEGKNFTADIQIVNSNRPPNHPKGKFRLGWSDGTKASSGERLQQQEWLDTVNVPPMGSVDLLMDSTVPIIRGTSLFRCHLLFQSSCNMHLRPARADSVTMSGLNCRASALTLFYFAFGESLHSLVVGTQQSGGNNSWPLNDLVENPQ
jgi:hypothetical protein